MVYTVEQAKEEIKKGVRAYLTKNENGDYLCDMVHRIPFYLEGMPGIGKTDIVRQVAEELGIGFVSYSITHHTRNSLLGLPVISDLECGKYTEYTMSEIIAEPMAMVQKGQKEGILLLDEFNCASETIMPAMLAFLQTRNIGKYRLPDGWCIVLCGNPPAYNKSARKLDAVILDRVRKMSIEYSVDDFLKYAKERGLHPRITAYLELYKENIYRNLTYGTQTQIVTCRGWENLSHALQAYEMLGQEVTAELIYQYIKSEEIAYSFYDYYMVMYQGLNIKIVYDILLGKNTEKHLATIQEKDGDFILKLVDVFVHTLQDCVRNQDKPGIISRRLTNAFRFLGQLQSGSFFTEMLFFSVNRSNELLQVLMQTKNQDYLRLCKKEYAALEFS